MNYEEKYKEALERMKSWVRGEHPECFCEAQKAAEFIFPELKESEDERIRKGLIKAVSFMLKGGVLKDTDVTREEALAWLEKQGEQKIDNSNTMFNACINALRNVGHSHLAAWLEKQNPAWSEKDKNLLNRLIGVLDGTNEEDYHEALEETFLPWLKSIKERMQIQPKQCEQSTDKIESNPAWNEEDEEMLTWLCRIIHTQRLDRAITLKEESELGEWIDKWLNYNPQTKQSEQLTDKIKPRFKEGDWITDGRITCKVLSVTGKSYELHLHNDDYCHFETDIQRVDKYYRLWTIQDAKDGDVLVDEDNNIGLYSGEKDDLYWHSCIYLGCDGYLRGSMGYHKHKNTKPATKEQRDMLFHKMKEEGYEWDNEKKELKMIAHKFNIDDWIVTDDSFGKIVRHVDEIRFNIIDKGYVVSDENGLIYNISFDKEHKWHKWTIQDAEDGDVLAVDPIDSYSFPVVAIYKERGLDFFNSYCCIGFDGKFYESESGHSIENIHPATKEQRDLFFQKMKQEGYDWDSEKN